MAPDARTWETKLAWLTPTSSAKLLACPASAALQLLPSGKRPPPPTSIPNNAGTLAHIAVQRWVECGGWRGGPGSRSLVEHFRREASMFGVAVEQLPDGRTTEARLNVRESSLAAAIRECAGSNGSILTEEPLYDDDNQLWGTVDLLIRNGQDTTIIDLKSGSDASKKSLPESIRNQLLHYALLVLAEYRVLPITVAVFSLHRGLRVVDVEAGDLEVLLAKVISARNAWVGGIRPAVPAHDSCHFCSRRLECAPHWAAIDTWNDPDAVQGELTLIENASNGSSSLTLSRDGKKAWVSDVPQSVATELQPGFVTRGVRLRRSHRELHEIQRREVWYADSRSAFSSLAEEDQRNA